MDFARSIGLRRPRLRGRISGLGASGEAPFLEDVEPGDVDERLARRDLVSRLGRRGAMQYLTSTPKGGLTDKQIFDIKRQQALDEFNQQKEFTHKFIELAMKAREMGDFTLQRHLISMGRDYVDRLSPAMKTLIEPILRAGPLSKEQLKLEQYDRLNPAPMITADKEKEPLAYAQQLFDREDWLAQRTHFATGTTGPKRSLISIDPERKVYAMRDKDGRVSLVNEESLAIKDFAKKFGISEGEVIANGGARGKEISIMINGKPTKMRPFTDFATGATTLESVPGLTEAQYNEREKQVAEFLAVLLSEDDKLIKKHPLARAVAESEKLEEGFDAVAPLLKQAFGYNFIRPKEEAGIFSHIYDIFKPGDYVKAGGYVESDRAMIRFVPGDPMALEGVKVFYDRDNDVVYSASDGAVLGRLNETIERLRLRRAELARKEEELREKREKRKALSTATLEDLNTPSY